MRKINLQYCLPIHNHKKTFPHSAGNKYGLLIQKIIFFLSMLVLQLFFTDYFVNAQYYNQTSGFIKANSRWAFGDSTGLEFTTGTALIWNNSIISIEGPTTISHPKTGDLLFYTNGGSVWNKNHQIMPNGTGLMGNSNNNYYSTIQGSLIVPFIEDSSKYYLFSLPDAGNIHHDQNSGKKGSLFYSIVDMNLDQGNGDVDTNYKNIVLDTSSLSEALIAVPGCNNDIWVLVHSFNQTQPVYKAYHITQDSINPTPVLSPSLIDVNLFGGSMAISPDRTKVAFAGMSNGAELSHFDPETGTISGSVNFRSILITDFWSTYSGYFHTAFSPDNKQLYFATYSITKGGHMLQYDITLLDSTAIELSKDTIAIVGGGGLTGGFGCIKLYNDTIYVTDYVNPLSIHRINQPNNPGTACDFQQNAIVLSNNRYGGALGNEVVLAIKPDSVYSLLDTIICSGWDAGVYLEASDTSYSSYTWSTGDTSSSIQINGHGTYWVSYFQCNKYHRDSFVVKGSDLYTDITVNGHQLGTTGGPFSTYQWYLNGEKILGATGPTITVTQNGDYTVEVTDGYGCVFMSAIYKVNNVNIRDLQQLARSIRIYPNPATEKININAPVPVKYVITGIDGKELIKGDNQLPVNISSLAQGIYFVTLTDTEGRMLKTEKIVKKP